mmetsp:Transcript_26630/g.55029  ORF Transcript_26630/g.55029 Transcript_26630/m.55029 type:complete len:306 (-) Transcript_26630:1125-2042(-)|eukprot:CAMPEP_0201217120 /NCGR_PEP_ID=MMETSP0851-20130426/189892_1 /ASSEMBLY_ACC=CAM_ASM_000631 /TAXON_ID=183588 /ORGANISM="Pseudo-nitzschia fraudulenta, Strain WWA7" /LENGTH=305 /DNA_ID=CAMNT_0047506755 /DNA_START=31 /DNA_END=948 /DNA_ORIENTATION=+
MFVWRVVLFLLLFVVDNPDTKSANAFVRNGFSEIPINNHGISVSSKCEWTTYSSKTHGTRVSCLCRAAKKDAEKSKSKKPKLSPSSLPKRNKGEPWYWTDQNCGDNFEVTFRNKDNYENDDGTEDEQDPQQILKLRFKIFGNPRPLQRHRTSRWSTYNPSVKYQQSFQKAFENLTLDTHVQNKSIGTPLFDGSEYLAMAIVFRMKRPKNHFVNNKPGPDRLKKNAPSQLSSVRTDVDNLTKFVLDSLNGKLYEDDRQVTTIHATKVLDNANLCDGSIEVYVRSVNLEDLENILESSISIIDQNCK